MLSKYQPRTFPHKYMRWDDNNNTTLIYLNIAMMDIAKLTINSFYKAFPFQTLMTSTPIIPDYLPRPTQTLLNCLLMLFSLLSNITQLSLATNMIR